MDFELDIPLWYQDLKCSISWDLSAFIATFIIGKISPSKVSFLRSHTKAMLSENKNSSWVFFRHICGKIWLQKAKTNPPPQSLRLHKLGDTLPTVINFIYYLDWFSSPFRRETRARLGNLPYCFSLQNLGKELHWQNSSRWKGSFTQLPTTQCLGAGDNRQSDTWKHCFGGTWKEKTRESCFSYSCVILRMLGTLKLKDHTHRNLLYSLSFPNLIGRS